MILQDIWELYWQSSGACSPLIGKYEIYCLHVCFCIICEICAVLNWSLDCAGRWYGKQARNETACDDQTAAHQHSPLLSAVNHSEVCLSWGQAYVFLIAVCVGVRVKSVSGFENWYVGQRQTDPREYMEVFWSVPAFCSQLLHFHGQIAVSCVWSDQLVLFIQNLRYIMLTLAGLTARLLVAVNLLWHFECYYRVAGSLSDSTVVELRNWSTVLCHTLWQILCVCQNCGHFCRWLLSLMNQKTSASSGTRWWLFASLANMPRYRCFPQLLPDVEIKREF